MESEFASSPYGIEVESMMKTCMEMQKNGLLPGIRDGEDKSLEFMSDDIEFSKRNEITYPIQLNCVVNEQSKEHIFSFIKRSSNSDWELSQKN